MSLISPVYAQVKNPLLPQFNANDPFPILQSVLQTLIALFMIVAVIYFTWQFLMGGFEYISSQGDPKKAEVARNQITNGAIGLVLILLIFAVLKIIGLIFNITSLQGLIISIPTL